MEPSQYLLWSSYWTCNNCTQVVSGRINQFGRENIYTKVSFSFTFFAFNHNNWDNQLTMFSSPGAEPAFAFECQQLFCSCPARQLPLWQVCWVSLFVFSFCLMILKLVKLSTSIYWGMWLSTKERSKTMRWRIFIPCQCAARTRRKRQHAQLCHHDGGKQLIYWIKKSFCK